MGVMKEFQYPVSLAWEYGRLIRAVVPGRDVLEIGPPPEYAESVPGAWTPEELLVTSVASCYAITFAAVAERLDIEVLALKVHGTGHVGQRDDGRFGFVAIELTVGVVTGENSVADARRAAAEAEERCLVAKALDVPVHIDPAVTAAAPASA
jgi:organic hydroperoxide reductase OsmC/OhrA